MLRTPPPQTFPPETLSLDELVPKDHLVRKIDAAIDFEFIRELVAPLSCRNNGRPAIDPVMLIKMLLLGYLFGVPSERRLVQEIQVNVAYRWFLRLGLTEKVHDSQPFIKRLTRQLERFALNPLAIGLNAGYFTAPVCYLTEQLGMTPIISYRRLNTRDRTPFRRNTSPMTGSKIAMSARRAKT